MQFFVPVDLDLQSCPSKGPNMSSIWIWRKSVQQFPKISHTQTKETTDWLRHNRTFHSSLRVVVIKSDISHHHIICVCQYATEQYQHLYFFLHFQNIFIVLEINRDLLILIFLTHSYYDSISNSYSDRVSSFYEALWVQSTQIRVVNHISQVIID